MASPATLSHDTGHPQSHGKGCTSASCCSPSKLWRTLQTIISTNDKQELTRLFQDIEKLPHVLRVLLTSRLTNDPSQYPASHKHRVIQLDPLVRTEATRKFGKSVTDLNAVQLCLFHKNESIAIQILTFVRQKATLAEQRSFVHHVWGNRNTSLHLASFLAMPRLVKLLLDMGADPTVPNARKLVPADVCNNQECLGFLQKASASQSLSPKSQKSITTPTTPTAPKVTTTETQICKTITITTPTPTPTPTTTATTTFISTDSATPTSTDADADADANVDVHAIAIANVEVDADANVDTYTSVDADANVDTYTSVDTDAAVDAAVDAYADTDMTDSDTESTTSLLLSDCVEKLASTLAVPFGPSPPSVALKRSPRILPIALTIVPPRTFSDDGLCVLPKDMAFPLSPVAEEEEENDEELELEDVREEKAEHVKEEECDDVEEDEDEWDLQLSRSSSISTVLSLDTEPAWPLTPTTLSLCEARPSIGPPEFVGCQTTIRTTNTAATTPVDENPISDGGIDQIIIIDSTDRNGSRNIQDRQAEQVFIDPIKPRRHLHVSFDPKAILVDACVKGDLGEVSQTMDAMLQPCDDHQNHKIDGDYGDADDSRNSKSAKDISISGVGISAYNSHTTGNTPDTLNDYGGVEHIDQRSLLQLAHLHGHKHIVRYLLRDTNKDLKPQIKHGNKDDINHDYLEDWPLSGYCLTNQESPVLAQSNQGCPDETFEPKPSVHPCQLIHDDACPLQELICWPEHISLDALERSLACQIIL